MNQSGRKLIPCFHCNNSGTVFGKSWYNEDWQNVEIPCPVCKGNKFVLETDEDYILRLKSDNLKLRKLLWIRHGCEIASLYGDDGEMQCGKCRIDFLRDSVELIENKFKSNSNI